MNGDWLIPADVKAYAESVRTFVARVIVPAEAPHRAASAGIPASIVSELQPRARERGLWCFTTPTEYGGAGLSPFGLAVVTEEAVRHTFSIPDPGDGIFGWDPPNVLLGGTEEQRERYVRRSVEHASPWFVGITEPTGGSDPARAIRTTAERRGDRWVLRGHKRYTGRADIAPHGIVYARTGEGRGAISAFIVDSGLPGMTVRCFEVIRDRQSCELILGDVEVPAENLLGEEGQGFALAQRWLTRGRIRIAAACIGVAQAALEMAIEHVRSRSTFGALLATRQAMQWMIADAEVQLRAARWLTWEAAWREERGLETRTAASIAKLHATEAAFKVLDDMIQIHGGEGVSRELPLEHWLRAVRAYRIAEGPSEIHRFVVARDLIGPASIGEGS
jgi:acyl-CoA dehydrogenase